MIVGLTGSVMFRRGVFVKRLALSAAVLAAVTITPTAASAAGDDLTATHPEQHRAAFAGATLRLPFGGRTAPVPEARLGIGLSSYRRDGSGALLARGGPALAVGPGLAEGRLQLFVGGESVAQIERRLGARGSTRTVLLVAGALAAGAAAVVLLTDGEDDDGPCPPGVEVCVF